MDWDLFLAAAHHLAVFALVAVFAAEFALVRPASPARASRSWHGSMPPMAPWRRWWWR